MPRPASPSAAMIILLATIGASPAVSRAAGATPLEFEVIAGPTLPVITSDVQSGGENSRLVVVLPELDAALMVHSSDGEAPTPSKPFPIGGLARYITSADIDGDGLTDLVSTSPTTGRAHIILQSTEGNYELGAILPIGAAPFAPAMADLNDDGLPELVVPLRGEAKIAILPNLGDGLFSAGIRVACGLQPDSVFVADFDRDGISDIAVTCTGSARLQVFYGDQDSTGLAFTTPPTELLTGGGPVGIVADDLDGDGWLDLATASTASSSVSIFYGGPSRTFEPGPYVFAGTSPQAIIAADFDQSGLKDLAVANPSTQTLTLLQNTGGRELLRSTVPMPFRPARLGASDLDGDGLIDLLVSSQTTVLTRVLRNTAEVNPCSGEVTGDLRVDLQDLNLVLANFGKNQSRGDANGDGAVDLADLNLVLANFGAVCGDR